MVTRYCLSIKKARVCLDNEAGCIGTRLSRRDIILAKKKADTEVSADH